MAIQLTVVCPSCKAQFQLSAPQEMPEKIRLRCSACRTIFVLRRKAGVSAPPPAPVPAPSQAAPAQRDGILVLVANESPEFCQVVRGVIEAQTDYRVEESHDGAACWQDLLRLRPHVLVTDVALPGLYGFQLAERILAEPSLEHVKVILIAAIYDRTRYKRNPTQLYGANDYVEKHHIPDLLVPKINHLLLGVSAGRPVGPQAARPQFAQAMAEAVETQKPTEAQEAVLRAAEPRVEASEEGLPDAEEKARRLARIIVSDIALYNQDVIEQGIRDGNVESVLAKEIAEARELYAQRVPRGIQAGADYLGEEVDRLIQAKRAEFSPGGGGE